MKGEPLSATIQTVCGHCEEPIELTLDSDLKRLDTSPPHHPMVFHPQVDWLTFEEPNIIHGF